MSEIEKIRKLYTEFITKTGLTPNLLVIPLSTFENWSNHSIFKELNEYSKYFSVPWDSHILGMKIIKTIDFEQTTTGLCGTLGQPFVCYAPFLHE